MGLLSVPSSQETYPLDGDLLLQASTGSRLVSSANFVNAYSTSSFTIDKDIEHEKSHDGCWELPVTSLQAEYEQLTTILEPDDPNSFFNHPVVTIRMLSEITLKILPKSS